MTGEPTQIAVAVVELEGRFLVGQRPAGAVLGGFWEFPGGKVRQDESAEEAARRECLEETGVAVDVLHPYRSQLHQYEHGRVYLHFFACRPIDPHPTPRPPYRWTPREDLPLYEFPAGNQPLLDSLMRSCSAPPQPGAEGGEDDARST